MKGCVAVLVFCIATVFSSIPNWQDGPLLHGEGSKPEESDVDTANPIVSDPAHFEGVLSCSATACHGSVRPDPQETNVRRDEYLLWEEHDPHSGAYRTLETNASKDMIGRLTMQGRAERTVRKQCIACHNLHTSTALTGNQSRVLVDEAVSCESCHGSAKSWRTNHYGGNSTRGQPNGIRNLRDPSVLAQTCVRCHVGDDGREVNHDLIAAGHPELKFELAAYYESLPKHWNIARERSQRQRQSFQTDLWYHGQIAAARAAVGQLKRRIVAAETKSAPWPEFAEYDCSSCHHDLLPDNWRRNRVSSTKLGTPLLEKWNYSPILSKSLPALENTIQDWSPDLKAVSQAIDHMKLPHPDALSNSEILGELHRILSAKGGSGVESWSVATQCYLSLSAINSSLDNPPALTQSLGRLHKLLVYGPEYNSPKSFNDATGDRSDKVLQEIRTAIGIAEKQGSTQ